VAEARLAVEVASGKSLEEVAEAVGSKVATVRKQLASVFMKSSR
jgi:DNA-binding CsgD family transcriptional regulator